MKFLADKRNLKSKLPVKTLDYPLGFFNIRLNAFGIHRQVQGALLF